ncbi:MAG TPA: PHP domain-containing protein [Streptosporangiaceae bacterium]
MRIDLHTHSSASDGTEAPARVMRRAADAGLALVALTDHDTLAGHAEARAALPPGLALVPGMELSSRLTGRSVHLLCYGVDPANAALAAECEAIRTDRLRRGQAMVGKLRDLGVDITWPQVVALADGGVVGRPHVARAMVEAGAVSRPQEAFGDAWIGVGGPAYVRRYALDPVLAIGLVKAAGGVAVLAHPGAVSRGWKIPGEVIAALARAGLAGLEIDHPDHDQDERRRLATLAADLDLVPTGGSDDHGGLTGYRIGCEVTAPDSFERLMSRRA